MNVNIKDNSGNVLKNLTDAKKRALEIIGQMAEGYAVVEIETNPRRVDTGRLKGSIAHDSDTAQGKVIIGTNVEYAKYVHFGTVKMAPNAFLEKALKNHVDQYKQIYQQELKK